MMRLFILFIVIFVIGGCSDRESSASDDNKPQEKKLQMEDDQLQNKDTNSGVGDISQSRQIKQKDFSVDQDDIVLGNPDAKVVIIEYFSPTCPHCFLYYKKAFPKIKEQYIDTNKIAYVLREFVSNKQDLDASILARCRGDVESYLRFKDVLLTEQDNWAFNKNYLEILGNIAKLGGVSQEEYATCLANDALIEQLIENTRLPVSVPTFVGTPSFFINGKHFTKPHMIEEFKKAIDEVLLNEQE